MKQFDVIMFNMSNYSEWDEGVSNRNWHVLKQLQNRPEIGKILAVDYLPLTLKRAIRTYKEDIVLNIKNSKTVKRGLTYKLSKISEKLYVYSDTNYFWRPQHTINHIKKIALQLNFGDLVVWSFFPFMSQHWQKLGQKLTIFDAVDNWTLHSAYNKQVAKLKKSYDIIRNESDLIFVVSKNLVNFFEDQANVYWIPNGVDIKHYTKKQQLVNRDIADIPKPIVGYIGVIQEKVDLELIKFLAEKNPKKSFVMVGPVWNEQDKAKLELAQFNNVYFLGYKSYAEAPMYIQQFDVGIIPHKKIDFSASTNPMKMYEYLATGLPVVASQGSGAEDLKEVVYLAKTYDEFNDYISLALKEKAKDKKQARLEFVKKYSWLSTVNKMMDLINNKIN